MLILASHFGQVKMWIGETGDPILAKAATLAMGEELLAVGINMNLSRDHLVEKNRR
jgi:hypothetical protein